MLRSVMLLACLILLPTATAAQVNIERLRPGDDSLGVSGTASVALTFVSGNTDKQRGDGELRLDWLRAESQSFVILQGDFDWTGGQRVSNKGLAHLRHIMLRTHRVSPELFGQINYDQARDLDLRLLVGAGVRTLLTESARVRASVGLAWMLEREEMSATETVHHRLSSFLTLALEPREGLVLASTSYVQPRVDRFDDVRVLSQSRLAVALLGPLTLDVTLDLSYDADPPGDVESLDTALKTGIGIRF